MSLGVVLNTFSFIILIVILDEVWRIALNFQPGTYQYKFIVNGEWVIDHAKPNENDNLGHVNVINNILTVKPRAQRVFNGFGAWFNVVFRGSDKTKEPIVLTTDPRIGYQTHWKQDVCLYRYKIHFFIKFFVISVIHLSFILLYFCYFLYHFLNQPQLKILFFLALIFYRNILPIPADNDINGVVKIEQMGDYKRHFAITISPSERAILRDEKCFPEQEWTF